MAKKKKTEKPAKAATVPPGVGSSMATLIPGSGKDQQPLRGPGTYADDQRLSPVMGVLREWVYNGMNLQRLHSGDADIRCDWLASQILSAIDHPAPSDAPAT